MKTKIITLPEAKERQEKIKKMFESKKINFEFVSGVTPADITFFDGPGFEEREKKYKINENNLLKYTNRLWIRFGEIGALMAHKKIWEELLNDVDEAYFICEDDCLLSDNFLIDSLNLFDYSKFDLLYLQAVTAHHQNKAEIIKNYPNADWDSNLKIINSNKMIMFEGFAGYCISKSGAQKAIEYIEKNGYDGPIDNLVCHIPNFISVCPVNLQNYLFLDETSKYSYTHTGNFLYNHKLNQINLQSKKQLKLKNENRALLS